MLQISRRVEYALRATLFLSRRVGGPRVSFKEIACHEEIPRQYLAKILKDLVSAGFVDSKRGASGGYSLCRPAERISFLEIIEAAHSPVSLNFCTEMGGGCAQDADCAMHGVWQEAETAMREVFRQTSLRDLAARAGQTKVPVLCCTDPPASG